MSYLAFILVFIDQLCHASFSFCYISKSKEATYLHEIISRVGVEIESCMFLQGGGECSVWCHHFSFYACT